MGHVMAAYIAHRSGDRRGGRPGLETLLSAPKMSSALVWGMLEEAPQRHHVPGDSRLGDLDSELEQLAMDAWHTPQRVLPTDSLDEASECRP
jgi:hypothetical protein